MTAKQKADYLVCLAALGRALDDVFRAAIITGGLGVVEVAKMGGELRRLKRKVSSLPDQRQKPLSVSASPR